MRGSPALVASALALALTACSSSQPPETTEGPDMYACTSDDECVNGSHVYEQNPCCDTGLGGAPQSKAYVEWRRTWLTTRCDPDDRAGGANCSCCPLPDGHYPPGQPLPCAFEPRCRDGRCTNACE